jgi:hypothetical protein
VQRGVCSHRSRPSRLPSVRNGAQRSRARPVLARRLPCLVCKLQTLRSSGFQGRNRRRTYASELLRAGVGLPALMNLLGHVDPDMTMRYLNVTLTDLKQEFQLARSEPRHLMPRANPSVAPFRVGLAGVTDCYPAPTMCWRCSAVPCQTALPARPSTDSPTDSQKSHGRKEPRPQLSPGRDWPLKRVPQDLGAS